MMAFSLLLLSNLLSMAPDGADAPIVTLKLSEPVGAFAISPDGVTIAYIRSGGKIRLVDLATGKEGVGLFGLGEFSEFRFTADGKAIMTLGPQNAIYALDGTKPKFTLEVPFSERRVPLKPDGPPDFSQPPGKLSGPGTATPALSADRKTFFAHDRTSNVVARELPTWEEVKQFAVGSPVVSIHPSPDGKFLVVWTETHVLGFSIESGKRLWRKESPDVGAGGAFVTGECVLCYGQRLGARDGVLGFQLLDPATGKTQPRRKLPESLKRVPSLDVTADGRHALIPNPNLPAIHVFDVASGEEVGTFKLPVIPKQIKLTPNGQQVLVSNSTETLLVIPAKTISKATVLSADELRSPLRKP
jgi:outer membrane protein assembly factor BamB